VDLVLNLMAVEQRIDRFLFQQLKKVEKNEINYSIPLILYSSGSPADKAGLCVDDEVISMNDENIENMTFDQVRKILKERNLRGSIKMIVKTYEGKLETKSNDKTLIRIN
jgi:C-terminal processing protease CtpA/Prc